MDADSLPPRVGQALRSFLQRFGENYPDARAYLHGSFARGDWLEDSDIDMVVVSRALTGEPVKRGAKLRLLAPSTAAFQILAYTPEEMKQLIQRSLSWQDIAFCWMDVTEEASDG